MPPKKTHPRQLVSSLPILPPGSEKCSNEQFGEFQLKMGKVQWVQDANPHQGNLLYRIKFLGQEGDGLLIQPANSSGNQQSEVNYEIRVPIIGFHRYLIDAEKLSILLVDNDDKFNILGITTINFARHLNKDLSRNQIFHNISGQYPIYKYFVDMPDNKEYRIGYQQIEINCKFILIQEQIELCQLLEQTANIQSLQMILDKQPPVQNTKQTQYPQVNVIFPTENEAWLQQNPNQKLANVLFANNPFENPKVEENPYDQNKYINPQQTQINQVQTSNQDSPDHNQHNQHNQHNVNNQQQQQPTSNNPSDRKPQPNTVDDVQRRMEQLFNQLHCIHCCPKRSESANNNQQNDSNKKQKSGQKEPEPFRNTKPGSGHYNNSPTGYRYANKGEAPKPVPPKFQSTRNKTPVTIPEGTQTEREEKKQTVKYQLDTKEVQTIQEAASTPVNKQKSINYNQALDSYRKLKLQLQDFHSYSSQVSEKLNAINLNNIFIDISFKNQQKRLFFKSQGQEMYLINETIELEVFINESSFSQFQADQVKFLIQCYRKPENSTDDKYFKITLGEGYFQVIQALSNEQFYIPITTNLPFDRQQTANSNLQYSVVNKNILNEYQLGNRLGEISLKATYQREKEQEKYQEQPLYHIYHSFNPTLLIRLGKLINLNQVYCRFKIPGSNDFFQSHKTDSLYLNYQIITPLNFESYLKLQASPLIIEIWKEEGLQGMIRISLNQISQTLTTEDQQFNTAIFKNTYPLIMSDEQLSIRKLRDQKEIGSLHVYIAFGSPSQIQKIKIENIQIKSIQEASNQYEELKEEPQQVEEVQVEEAPRELTFQEQYENFQLDKNENNHASIIQLLQFMSKNEILLQKHLKKAQFVSIAELEFLNFDNHSIFVFCRIFDYQNQNSIKQEDLLQSLTAYNLFCPRISIEVNKQVKRLISYWMDQKVDSLDQVGKMLIKSNCGQMDRKRIASFIGSFNFEFFEYFLATPNDRNQLSIKLLNELVCQFITYNYVKLDISNESWFCWLVQNSILQKVQTISLEEIEQMVLNLREVQDILSACMINISFWEVYCLFRYIKLKYNNFLLQEWQLQKSLLQEWLNQREEEQPEVPKQIKKPKFPEFDDKENQNQENQAQPQEFYVHKFSITLKEISNLKLQIAHGTQMEIEFRYPLCEQTIKSYPLIYSKLTQYQVPSESMYTYIQSNDGKNKLIDVVDSLEGGILFRLKANDQTLAQTLLSSQEIVNWMEKASEINKDKILVLMPVNAKLSFSLNYTRELITQQQLSSNPELLASHNQTQQEIHLPKRVGLSVYAEITVNDKALKFEDKILKVDIFSVVNFASQISKQQGQKTVIINEEKPLAVDNELIQQLTTSQMIIQVSSNSQSCIGKCELMQAQLLRTAIEGEFALTNAYGLFVGFAKLKVQLNKYKLPLAQQQTILKEKEAVEKQITCIFSFKEIIISLGTLLKPAGSDEIFIYFSIKHNGKVHSTNPQQIDKKKLSCQLVQSIALELSNYQEISITVYSSKKNQVNQLKDVKLGELCIKFNSLTQSQMDSKFICINDYFTLNYESFVSRVGIKLMLINEYDEQIPNFIKFYQNNQIYGCTKISDLKLDRYLNDYLVKLVGTQEQAFLCDQIGYHMNKQNFFLSESNITWDLIEEVYKLSANGFMTEEKAKALLDSFFIVNFTEKSYSLFTKPNVFDKFVDKHLNQFDCQVFLSKLNLNFEVQKLNEIILQIVKASNLHVLNQNKAPNAVVQVMFNGESYRTPVQVRESNPVFNYCFNVQMEPNQNIEFRVLNSGAERESLGSCFINSSELIKKQQEQSSEEIKMYVHGSKAQAYVVVKVGNEQPYLKTLEEVQKYEIHDVDFERIRAIIGKQ